MVFCVTLDHWNDPDADEKARALQKALEAWPYDVKVSYRKGVGTVQLWLEGQGVAALAALRPDLGLFLVV